MNIEAKERVLQINMGQVPQGYKKTKVGIIPNEWPYDRFKNIVKKSQYGLSLAKNIKGNIKILDMSHLQNGHIINKDLGYVSITPDEYENYIIKKGDFLFNRTNSYDLVGKSAVAKKDYEFVFASYLVRFKFKEKCNFQYIGEWFALSHKTNIIKRLVTKGVGQCNINPTELQKYFYIPLPPLTEQQIIAEILSICDEIIELKEILIEQKKQQKKYLMQSLLDPKSPNFRRLTGFRGEWKEVKLGDFIYETKDLTIIQDQYRLLTSSKNGIVLQEDYFNKIVSSDENIGYKIIKKGEFTFRSMSDTGFFKINRLKGFEIGMVSPAYNVFNIRKADNDFMIFFLNSYKMIYKYSTIAQGGTRLALKIRSLAKLNVIIPNLEEQTAITKILSTADKEINLLEKGLEQQKLKKKALMQLLLTGKVRIRVS
jgi:type I restriction enzyme S subunit